MQSFFIVNLKWESLSVVTKSYAINLCIASVCVFFLGGGRKRDREREADRKTETGRQREKDRLVQRDFSQTRYLNKIINI